MLTTDPFTAAASCADDFTTAGMSLEWARILLTKAGAAQVIGLTIGKYRKPHTFYIPRPGVVIDPYTTNKVAPADFQTSDRSPGFGTGPPRPTLSGRHQPDAREEKGLFCWIRGCGHASWRRGRVGRLPPRQSMTSAM
ncbi:hypothetical protein ACIRYZ_46025, partial [Kitasatospora sp. NPDC101155]|uniref:hypothetical protein n=1 Tax=Kitasatospora sp. NPDC101155 TaxID=3364097 RepID=UPI0037FDB8B3